jgi:hypothetical protein
MAQWLAAIVIVALAVAGAEIAAAGAPAPGGKGAAAPASAAPDAEQYGVPEPAGAPPVSGAATSSCIRPAW